MTDWLLPLNTVLVTLQVPLLEVAPAEQDTQFGSPETVVYLIPHNVGICRCLSPEMSVELKPLLWMVCSKEFFNEVSVGE